MIPSTEDVRTVARQSLRDNFPLYQEKHTVNAVEFGVNKIRLAYRTTEDIPEKVDGSTHLDMEFWFPRVGILNSIGVRKEERGQGTGSRLYLAAEDIARKLGCDVLTQIPSGIIVVNGNFIETREDYLLRRGYRKTEDGQVEKRL